ncbi:hypothetical protein Ddc_18383 [Ditylenchus destructor]|nr:hypothetical protein Ddc_18383 [Ditylenchus destructor]
MFSAERSAIEIDGESLLEVCHFFNRKYLTHISTVNRRFRDLIHTHLRQTPFLLLPRMYLPLYGEEKALVQIQGLDWYRSFTPNEPPLCSPAPSYLRFTWVEIKADHIFDFCPYEFMGLFERFQSAFVDCILGITIGYVNKPFSKRSFLYFLKQQLLPLFTKCSKYVITSPYLRIYDPKERETEQLLLVPQLYNSGIPIELDFDYPGSKFLPDEYFGPTISVSEVITWLNHPNPIEDPSKPRVLKLACSCLSDMSDGRLEKARDIKNRLIEFPEEYCDIESGPRGGNGITSRIP